jgi:NADH-quinone oxidoreductase subunit N
MAAYALGALGLLLVVAQEGATLQDVAGLVKRRPYAAWTSVIFLFSIIGFPPFVGFYGKLAVFSAAYNAGHVWAVVAAILMSVVAGGYAFNVIRAMFTPGEGAPAEVEWHPLESRTEYPQAPAVAATTILVLGALTLGLGLWVEPVLEALATVLR